jgi:hypothetical protein
MELRARRDSGQRATQADYTQQAVSAIGTSSPHRAGGLVSLHEPEQRFEGPLYAGNQAAVF